MFELSSTFTPKQSNGDLNQAITDHLEWLTHLSERVETLHMNTTVFVQVRNRQSLYFFCTCFFYNLTSYPKLTYKKIELTIFKKRYDIWDLHFPRWTPSLVHGQENRAPNTSTAGDGLPRMRTLSQSMDGLQFAHGEIVMLLLKCPVTGDLVDIWISCDCKLKMFHETSLFAHLSFFWFFFVLTLSSKCEWNFMFYIILQSCHVMLLYKVVFN